MNKTLITILLTAMLVILNACTTPITSTVVPPTQIPASTSTAIPPTPTSLPPTPALSGLLLSNETLSTEMDGLARYALSNAGWEPISPDVLSNELAALEGWNYARNEQGALQIVDLEGNPLWIEKSGVWIQFSAELPEEFQVVNNRQNLVDVNGNPLEWMELVDGKMVIKENPRESLELAQKISEDAIEIRGDLAYNSRGGIVAVYENGNWTTTPFTNEELEQWYMIKMQAIYGGTNLYSQSWKVETFTVNGEPGKGAVEIFGQDGELVAYVAVEVRAWSVVDKQQQVANIPIIYYDKTGKQIVIFERTLDNGYYNKTLEYYVNDWIPFA